MISVAMNGQDGNGGIMGGLSQLKSIQKEMEESAKRPKPGKYCVKTCRIHDDRCKACVELQEKFDCSLHQLEKMEEMLELTSAQVQELSSSAKITECSLCGAPFEKGKKECPYCGTSYPQGALDFDVPLSKSERTEQFMEKVQETWDVFLEKERLIREYYKSLPGAALAETLEKLNFSLTGNTFDSMLEQNSNELKQGAEHYKVPISQYLYGIAMGNMKTPKSIIMEEQQRIQNEQMQQRNAARAAQQAQRAQKSSFTAMDYMQRHAETTSYNYLGGSSSSHCCGTCRYYLVSEKKCLYYAGTSGEYRSGPNDYCNSYSS